MTRHAHSKRNLFGLEKSRVTYHRDVAAERARLVKAERARRAELMQMQAEIAEDYAYRLGKLDKEARRAADVRISKITTASASKMLGQQAAYRIAKKAYRLGYEQNPATDCARTRKAQVSDRAKRYRANQPGCRPAGRKQCKVCKSRTDVMVDHVDGNESNGKKTNLRWLCRSCNNLLGAEMARTGQGRRTVQYNPAHKGAQNVAEYVLAVLQHRRGAHDAGGKIIHATPKAKRREYAALIWDARHARGTAAHGTGGQDEPDWVTSNPARQRYLDGNIWLYEQPKDSYGQLSGPSRIVTRGTPVEILEKGRGKRLYIGANYYGTSYYGWVNADNVTLNDPNRENPAAPNTKWFGYGVFAQNVTSAGLSQDQVAFFRTAREAKEYAKAHNDAAKAADSQAWYSGRTPEYQVRQSLDYLSPDSPHRKANPLYGGTGAKMSDAETREQENADAVKYGEEFGRADAMRGKKKSKALGIGTRGSISPKAVKIFKAAYDRAYDEVIAAGPGSAAVNPLPERSADTMSEAIALSSPSGRMSGRSRAAAQRRLGAALFGDYTPAKPAQPDRKEYLLHRAKYLRDMAARGMSVRAFTKEADKLEAEARTLNPTANPSIPGPAANPAAKFRVPEGSEHFKAGYRWLLAKRRTAKGSFLTTPGADAYLKKHGYEGTLSLDTSYASQAVKDRYYRAKQMRQEFLDGAEAAWNDTLAAQHPGDDMPDEANPRTKYPSSPFAAGAEAARLFQRINLRPDRNSFLGQFDSFLKQYPEMKAHRGVALQEFTDGFRSEAPPRWLNPEHALYSGLTKQEAESRKRKIVSDERKLAKFGGGNYSTVEVRRTFEGPGRVSDRYGIFVEPRASNPEPAGDLQGDGSAEYEQARRTAELFHGRPVQETIEVTDDVVTHDWHVHIGPLVSLKFRALTKRNVTLPFSQENGAVVNLWASPDGRQFYLRGGDQELDLKPIGMGPSTDWYRDHMLLGEAKEITYRDRKKFHKFKLTDYYHKLGEENGQKPMVEYDTLSKHIKLVGGQSKIELRKLVENMSPGIVN